MIVNNSAVRAISVAAAEVVSMATITVINVAAVASMTDCLPELVS